MDNTELIAVLVIAALVVIALAVFMRRKSSENLQQRFGPEYDRAVEQAGSREKAEAELRARQKRVDNLDIVPLPPQEAQWFQQQWRALQARFVDSPQGVLADADDLVRRLMDRRGYPTGDFERRAADISVNHPGVVEHYRAAHAIAEQDRSAQVDTEGLRQAVIHYRALFAELLEVEEPPQRGHHHHQMRTQP
jgi:hypothetical protein